MEVLDEKNLVVHSNYLGRIIDSKMTMIQHRFFVIYLSKLNPYQKDTRRVIFSLEEYAKLMCLGRFNITKIKKCANDLTNAKVCIDLPSGGFTMISIFSEFTLDKINDRWVVSINCNDKLLPFLFGLKKEYTQYELWNILQLGEKNHQQMYRTLKQYEKIKHITIQLDDLKYRLGLEGKYKEYYPFKIRVLESCKKALAENTDIYFLYEPIRKGRYVHSLKFMIYQNKANMDKPLLSEFVASMASNADSEKQQNSVINVEPFDLTMDQYKPQKLENEFSKEQVIVLIDIIKQHKPNITAEQQNMYLQKKYNEMCMRKPNTSRFGYLKKIIESDDQAIVEIAKPSFNVELLDRYWDKIPTYDD